MLSARALQINHIILLHSSTWTMKSSITFLCKIPMLNAIIIFWVHVRIATNSLICFKSSYKRKRTTSFYSQRMELVLSWSISFCLSSPELRQIPADRSSIRHFLLKFVSCKWIYPRFSEHLWCAENYNFFSLPQIHGYPIINAYHNNTALPARQNSVVKYHVRLILTMCW